MAEETFAVRDVIEVRTGKYKGRQGAINSVPRAPGVFYEVSLWHRDTIGRRGQAHYQPSQPGANVSLTAGQLKLVKRAPP